MSPDQDNGEASDFDLADSKAAQTVMRAATAYPLNDAQLERIVKLALGKRILEAAITTASGGPFGATTSMARTIGDPRARTEVMPKDECEDHRADSTEPEEPPPANGTVRPATPSAVGVAAGEDPETPAAQPPGGVPPSATVTTPSGGKKKGRAAKKAARAAAEASSATPAADGEWGPAQEEPRQCPVFGCTRGHDPGDCPTFLDMTPKERLDMIHAKQQCLLCLRHPLSVGCEVAGKGAGCPMGDCDRPHHATLHEVLKAGGPPSPVGKADLPGGPAVPVDCETPEMTRLLRGWLEGLVVDPNDLEVRIGVRQPGELGRPRAEDARGPEEAEASATRMAGRLLEALTSLCQAGERFVDSAAVSGRRVVRMGSPAETRAQRPRMIQGGSAMGGTGCTPGRNSEWIEHRKFPDHKREDGIEVMGEKCRALEGNEYARGGQGSLERYGGLPRVVILTPEGGQLINMGIGRGYVFSVISQEAAARYAMHRSKLPEPLMITGPAGQQVRATGRCEIAFPQEKGVSGKMIIFAFEVDKLEEAL